MDGRFISYTCIQWLLVPIIWGLLEKLLRPRCHSVEGCRGVGPPEAKIRRKATGKILRNPYFVFFPWFKHSNIFSNLNSTYFLLLRCLKLEEKEKQNKVNFIPFRIPPNKLMVINFTKILAPLSYFKLKILFTYVFIFLLSTNL